MRTEEKQTRSRAQRLLASIFRRHREAEATLTGKADDISADERRSRRQLFLGAAGAAIGGTALLAESALRPGAASAQTSDVVDLTSDQTIGGVKTFSAAPVVPNGAFPEAAVADLVNDLAGKQPLLGPNAYVVQNTTETILQGVVPPGGAGNVPGHIIPGLGFSDEHDTGLQNQRIGSNAEVNMIFAGKRGLTFFEDDTAAVVGISGTGSNRVIIASEQAGLNFFAKSGHIEWEGQDGAVISITGYQLSTAIGKPIRFTTDAADTPACPLQAQGEVGVNAFEWYDRTGVLQGALTETGDVELFGADKGIILHSASGKRWRAKISDTGAWVITSADAAPVVTGPSVTVNQAAGQADPTSSSPVHFTVVFSAVVTDFTSADVALSGTAGPTTAVVTGSGTTYDVAVSGMATSGTVIASVAAGTVHDAAGNANSASTSTDNVVTYNVRRPK